MSVDDLMAVCGLFLWTETECIISPTYACATEVRNEFDSHRMLHICSLKLPKTMVSKLLKMK